MFPRNPSTLARYGFTIAAVTFATLLRFTLEPVFGFEVPFIIYFPTVVLCAWFGGLRPGLLSTALSGITAWYLFIPPKFSFAVLDRSAIVQLVIFLLAGALISLLAESLHVARRKTEQSEAKAREEHERLRVTLSSIGDGAIATDANGIVVFINSVAAELTGWNEEGVGRPLEEVFKVVNEQTRSSVENPALRSMRAGNIVGLANHSLLIAKNGFEIPIDDSGAAIKDSEGNIVGSVLIFRDITERKRVEKERALHAAIVESSEDAIISKNFDGIIETWNAAAERMFGYSATEAIGQPITLIVPPDRLEEEQVILERIHAGQRIESFETVRLSKSGKPIDLSVTISPVRDAAGQIIGASKSARDITERKRVEEALLQHRELLRVTLSSIGDAVITTDMDGLITFLNPVAAGLTGWSEEEAKGRPLELIFNIVNEQTHKHVENPAVRAIKEGVIFGLANHTLLIAKDGSEIPIDDSGAPIKDVDGRILGAVLVFRDITDRKLVEDERGNLLEREKAARELAEAALRARDEFVAIVSHELRSPLNAILGWASILRGSTSSNEETDRRLEIIERNARAQVQIIDDLLDISRVMTGKLKLNRRTVEPSEIIESAIDSIRPAADAKSIQLRVQLASSGSVVSGDPSRLQQIVWNLLSNAVKFTPRGGRVTVKLENVGPDLIISVSDSGEGITPEFLPYVFDRFTQATTTTERKYGGLGLGLAIVRHLVELHGGTVHAESPGDEGGATFTVTLPIRMSQEPLDNLQTTTFPHSAIPLSQDIALGGLRVMIIEDNDEMREMTRVMLTQRSAEVRCCASAAEAYEQLQHWQPDIIICDIGMPEEDGYSFIRRVRSLERQNGWNIPAVALTGYARTEDRTRALAAGFQMHVSKPVEATELLLVIASLAGRARKA